MTSAGHAQSRASTPVIRRPGLALFRKVHLGLCQLHSPTSVHLATHSIHIWSSGGTPPKDADGISHHRPLPGVSASRSRAECPLAQVHVQSSLGVLSKAMLLELSCGKIISAHSQIPLNCSHLSGEERFIVCSSSQSTELQRSNLTWPTGNIKSSNPPLQY